MKEENPQTGDSGIISCLRAELPAILHGRLVMLAYLFGWAAEGTALPSSDVDIALVLEPKCDLSAYERMKMEFDIAAEVEARCKRKGNDARGVFPAVEGRGIIRW